MTPVRVLLLSIALGITGILLPVILAIYLSWVAAQNEETARLQALARQTIERTRGVFREVTTTLTGIAATGLAPCSREHIAEMRRLTINALFIEEIGYAENGVLRCTSWGVTDIEVRQRPFDFTTQDGVAVAVNVSPLVSRGHPMMALRLGTYNALVTPMRIVDVLADPDLKAAVAHAGGTVIATRDNGSDQLVPVLFQDGVDGRHHGYSVATSREGEWVAALAAPTSVAEAAFTRQIFLFVPIGVIMGGFVAGAVFRLSRKRLSVAGALALAVRRREFIVYYQPIIDLQTGVCVGAEALVRWRMRDGAIIRPEIFIPDAEKAGLLPQITEQVVANVISDLRLIFESDRGVHISINLSAADMQGGRILDVLQTALADTDINPSQIWLEATERGFMELEPARAAMTRARSLGHAVMIDDFGTGFSSLQYLSRLPLDALKIDRSFVEPIGRDAVTSQVALYIIEMARALKLFIVAEGIENQEQADYLAAHGVDYAQGWLFSPPLPALEFIDFMQQTGRPLLAAPALSSSPNGT